jgi:hypothetical protein
MIAPAFDSIDALRGTLGNQAAKAVARHDPAYVAKMLHPFPKAEVIRRHEFLLKEAAGKVVLDVGASGPMHAALAKTAAKCYGWDREDGPGVTGINLDDVSSPLPVYADVQLVICGEVLEHLSNPGWFLTRLRQSYPCPTIVTVPNAYCEVGRQYALKGVECVNLDHVSWYSPKTLSVLLARAGYQIVSLAYYNDRPIQPPQFAEGIVVVAE